MNRSKIMFFFFQAEDGIRDADVTGVQTCALPIYSWPANVDQLSTRRPGILIDEIEQVPSYRTGEETMLTDFRKLLDMVAVRAGWKPGEIRSKMFRHTYCAARLQTLDQGAPVSLFTVAKELGHGGEAMLRRV